MAFSVAKLTDETFRISLTRGDTLKVDFQIKKDGAEYIPADGDVIRFAVKKKVTDARTLINKVIPNDTMQLILNPEDTKRMAFGEYRYDVQITFADGTVNTFITDSPFVLTNEVE